MIPMNTSKTECRPLAEASRAAAALELLEETGEVDLTIAWKLCQHCGSIHSRREGCSVVYKTLNRINPFRNLIMSAYTIRLYQFTFMYVMVWLTFTIMLRTMFDIFICPDFSSAPVNDSLLPVGHAHSSFVFSRENQIFVGRMELSPCSSENQTIQVNWLQWSPPAVSLNSPVFLNMSTQVFDTIEAPVEVSVEVSRFVFITWVSVPCIDDLGSCTYQNVCELSPAGPQPCRNLPDNFHLPCECPVKAGKYFIKNGEVQLPHSGVIPEWLTRGWFKAAVKVRDPVHNKQLACYQAKIHIE